VRAGLFHPSRIQTNQSIKVRGLAKAAKRRMIFLHRKRIVVKSGRIDRRTQSAFWYPMEKAFRGEDKAFQKPKNDFPWGMNNMFAPSVRW